MLFGPASDDKSEVVGVLWTLRLMMMTFLSGGDVVRSHNNR